MKPNAAKRIEQYRVAGDPAWGAVGAFQIPHPSGVVLRVIASDGVDWSCSFTSRARTTSTTTNTACICGEWLGRSFRDHRNARWAFKD